MAFSQTARVWWDPAQPGAGTGALVDATPDAATPSSPDNDTGVAGRPGVGKWFICERSGFGVPFSETIIDPNSGRRVWRRFVDPLAPASISNPTQAKPFVPGND